MTKLDTKKEALEYLTSLIQMDTPFAFTKFGDTELFCISKQQGTGGEHAYSPEAAEDLMKAYRVLREHAYLGDWKWNAQAEKLALENRYGPIANPVFYDAILFHENWWLTETLRSFYDAIRNSRRKKIYIANKKLAKAQHFLGLDYFTEVPERDAYTCKDAVLKQLKFLLSVEKGPVMVLTSCSILAKVIAAFVVEFRPNAIVIDLGSALDPLFIGNTRAQESNNSNLAKQFFNIE